MFCFKKITFLYFFLMLASCTEIHKLTNNFFTGAYVEVSYQQTAPEPFQITSQTQGIIFLNAHTPQDTSSKTLHEIKFSNIKKFPVKVLLDGIDQSTILEVSSVQVHIYNHLGDDVMKGDLVSDTYTPFEFPTKIHVIDVL